VIGTKMLLVDVYKVPVLWSLTATVAILATTMLLSLAVPPRETAHRGAYPFTRKRKAERQAKR
jgi:tellurite resistance protein TerC